MKRNDGMQIVILILLLLAHLSAGGAWAEDPKAAARAIGEAGRAAAAAVAKDPASASKVPGYAGTNLPERDLGAADLEAAAERALADPGDPGGRAGRAVIEGVTGRPEASLGTEDPIARRGEEIEGDAGAPRWGAGGLASGSVRECGAGVEDAGAGGPCGSVSWCAGAGCETLPTQANTGFIDSAAKLDVLQVWISDLHRTIEERAGAMDVADGERLSRWREGLRRNRTALARHRHEGLERFNTALAVVEKLRLIETELAGALSAELRAALAFSRCAAGAR